MGTPEPTEKQGSSQQPGEREASKWKNQHRQRQAGRETLTSASRSSLCQSHTDSTWSLESSTAHRLLPPFWKKRVFTGR